MSDDERWALWVDIDGFSAMYKGEQEDQALTVLYDLMWDIFLIGKVVYPGAFESSGAEGFDNKRLFAYQYGDGFLISLDFGFHSTKEVIDIAVALLRATAFRGLGYLRCGVSRGSVADIVGCYPPPVQEGHHRDGRVELGHGLMTISPVMGLGLVRAVDSSKRGPRGPLLLLDGRFEGDLDRNKYPILKNEDGVLVVDWVRCQSPGAQGIIAFTGGPQSGPANITLRLLLGLEDYLKTPGEIPGKWREGAESLLRGAFA
jgi:hypothetical protein